MLESVFTTRAVASNLEFMKRFVAADLPVRLKMLNRALHESYEVLALLRESVSPKILVELSEQIKQLNVQQISAENLSRAAGMHEWYVSLYTHLSGAVHTSVRDLESYLEIGPNKEVRVLKYAPELDDVGVLVHSATHAVVLAALSINELFGREFRAALEGYLSELQEGKTEAD
jgi:hypothetical protein